ncbi:hypothetical protein [Streptosporangium sp. NPDC051022]
MTEQTNDGTPTEPVAADDLDWFEDVPDENIGNVLSLDEIAPHAGI